MFENSLASDSIWNFHLGFPAIPIKLCDNLSEK